MYIKPIIKVTLLAASLFCLAACSTANPDGGAYGPGMEGGATANGLGEGTSFDNDGGIYGTTMKVGNQSYFFDFDSNNVHPADIPSIKVQAHYLATHPKAKVLLAGNTDERGSREYNIGLGERRAASVEAVLEAAGVNKNQIVTVSYGAEKPVALGHDEASYCKNRRVDLIYKK